jgi:integrase
MAIEKRGKYYWYSFVWRGERIRESTRQTNRQVARDMQAAHRTRLAKGEAGIVEQAPIPTFRQFAKRFEKQMESHHANKPNSLASVVNSLKMLALYQPLQNARLDRVDRQMIDAYIAMRRKTKRTRGSTFVKISTINRELETLRRALRLAADWDVITRAPKISRLPGEVGRERILDHSEEQVYLEASDRLLRDVATTILDGGFRPEEVFRMRWEHVHFQPVGNAQFGYIHNPFGKTKFAKRNISMTGRVRSLLEMRHTEQGHPSEGWVFPADTATGHVDSLKSQHARALKGSGLALVKGSGQEPIVLYSLRHTMLTRLGEAGADAFSIQKIAGHSSILVSQKYVHPTGERIEGAFTALATYNAAKIKELKQEQERERLGASVQ